MKKLILEIPDRVVVGSITLVQEPDSCQDSDSEYQKLTIEVDNAGGGNFVRVKTNNWAFDDTEMKPFIKLFKSLMDKRNDTLEMNDV